MASTGDLERCRPTRGRLLDLTAQQRADEQESNDRRRITSA